MIHPLGVYDVGLLGGAGSTAGGAITVRMTDGTIAPLALDRYLGVADATDLGLLDDLSGPVLDVGCGPGRMLHALARRGVFALGVDLSSAAVELARGRGANAIVGSIFDEVPGAGGWQTALLLDGNIGIGGAPVRLLERIGGLLGEGGRVLVELERPGVRGGAVRARLEAADGSRSSWFPWARVGCDDIARVARRTGFGAGCWESGGRWFATLTR